MTNRGRQTFAFLLLALLLAAPGAARAQCETDTGAENGLWTQQGAAQEKFDKLVAQELDPHVGTKEEPRKGGFASNALHLAYKNLSEWFIGGTDAKGNKVDGFSQVVEKALNEGLSGTHWSQDLSDLTRQLSIAETTQAYMQGAIGVAGIVGKEKARREAALAEATLRYGPVRAAAACTIDEGAPDATLALTSSRHVTRALELDSVARGMRRRGYVTSANDLWTRYSYFFCDPRMGDQGCLPRGESQMSFAGKNRDLSGMLWGFNIQDQLNPNNRGIDLSRYGLGVFSFAGEPVPNDFFAAQEALRTMVDPVPPEPLTREMLTSSSATTGGPAILLARRARQGTVNTIYNTLGAMLAERMHGSPVVTGDRDWPRSYTSIIDSQMPKPADLLRLIGSKEQALREQGAMNALRLRTMNDIYRRSEEMLFMEAASYAQDLNAKIPRAAPSGTPFRTRAGSN